MGLSEISSIATLVGFPLTVGGLWLTYKQARAAEQQARGAQDAATLSARAVNDFKLKAERSNAAENVHRAMIAVDTTRRHIANDAWDDALQSYDDARRSIIRFQLTDAPLSAEENLSLNAMKDHISSFCDQVDIAKFGKGEFPEKAGVMSVVRGNYEILASVKHKIDRDAL